jgi:hypothetical protein
MLQASYARDVETAIRYIAENVPRVFVNVLQVIDVGVLYDIDDFSIGTCPCGATGAVVALFEVFCPPVAIGSDCLCPRAHADTLVAHTDTSVVPVVLCGTWYHAINSAGTTQSIQLKLRNQFSTTCARRRAPICPI